MLTPTQKALIHDRIALAEMELAALRVLVTGGDEIDARSKCDDVITELHDVQRSLERAMFDNEEQGRCASSCQLCSLHGVRP